jgi:tetratricopeptide (TPR) repeat protein
MGTRAKARSVAGRELRALLPFLSLLLLPALPGCLTCPDERVQQFTEDGIYLYQRGDYGHARECFEAAAELQPGDANLLYNIAQCHENLGKVDKAQEYYRLCLDRSANHARCRHSLAVLLFRTGRAAEADRMIHDWLASEPELPDALVEDGWRLRQEGQLQQAQARFQQALHHDPHHVRALTEMGLLYEQLQLPERALTLYQRALTRDPKQGELVERVNALKTKGVGLPKPD